MLSPADVERIATLARLELTDEERTRFAAQLSGILGYADQVQQADTAGVSADPTIVPLPRLRDDRLRPSLDRDEVLAAAPSSEDGRFRVPPMLGEAP